MSCGRRARAGLSSLFVCEVFRLAELKLVSVGSGARHWGCLKLGGEGHHADYSTTEPQHHITTWPLTKLILSYSLTGSRRCPRYLDTSSHICREGHTYRGFFHPRAAHPWRPGGVQPRRDRSRPVCWVRFHSRPGSIEADGRMLRRLRHLRQAET